MDSLETPRLVPRSMTVRRLARFVTDALRTGAIVEIDGLGKFVPHPDGGYDIIQSASPRVFIAYVHEDAARADELFDHLTAAGFDAWMDRRKLMPGQNWPLAIENAIELSDFVVACFSSRAARKQGGFQTEIRQALAAARRFPLGDVFLIPVRLEVCVVPQAIQREVQYVDLFPDPEAGFHRIVKTLRAQIRRRKALSLTS